MSKPNPESLETATPLIGELFPDCGVCCSAATHGDLCKSCKRAWLIVATALDAALQRGEKKGLERAAEKLYGLKVEPCRDPAHDVRYCQTCDLRADGIEWAEQAIRAMEAE